MPWAHRLYVCRCSCVNSNWCVRLCGALCTCALGGRVVNECCVCPCPALCADATGRPAKRFRKSDEDNVNDLSSFIGRGFTSLKSLTNRNKSSTQRVASADIDDLSPTADKLPV